MWSNARFCVRSVARCVSVVVLHYQRNHGNQQATPHRNAHKNKAQSESSGSESCPGPSVLLYPIMTIIIIIIIIIQYSLEACRTLPGLFPSNIAMLKCTVGTRLMETERKTRAQGTRNLLRVDTSYDKADSA